MGNGLERREQMTEIAVDTLLLKADIEKIQTGLQNINNEMNLMYEGVEVLDRMWDGPANEVFKIQFTNDKNKMQELCKQIQEYIDTLNNAKKEYEVCEAEVKGIIDSIVI